MVIRNETNNQTEPAGLVLACTITNPDASSGRSGFDIEHRVYLKSFSENKEEKPAQLLPTFFFSRLPPFEFDRVVFYVWFFESNHSGAVSCFRKPIFNRMRVCVCARPPDASHLRLWF